MGIVLELSNEILFDKVFICGSTENKRRPHHKYFEKQEWQLAWGKASH